MSGYPTGGESREAHRLGGLLGPDLLAERACLFIRCTGCAGDEGGGMRVAVVAYVQGRPLMAARDQPTLFLPGERKPGRGWIFTWLDRGNVLHVRCRNRRHPLSRADVLDRLPPQRRRARIETISVSCRGSEDPAP